MKIKYHGLEFTPLQLISYIHFNNKLWLLKLIKKILFGKTGVILDCHFKGEINLLPGESYIINGNKFGYKEDK